MALFTQYAIAAADEALTDAGLTDMSDELKEQVGVCVGSGIGSLDDVYNTTVAYEKGGYKKISPLFVPRLLINMAAGHITMKYGFRGPNHAVSTACTTGLHSLGDAFRILTHSSARTPPPLLLAGGSESCILPLALSGFARAKSLCVTHNDSPQTSSRPFDSLRSGFVMGEGCGLVVLEELGHALARGANIYAEVKGYGVSGDAHHMTAPPEDGTGAYLAMKRALLDAQIAPKDVDYVNAHATSTLLGDRAENRAIKRLLLDSTSGHTHPQDINVSSTKGAIGHLLGAAGAVETIFTILAIKEGVLPPTLNLENPGEPKDDFNCNYVAKEKQERRVKVALSNSFGFGGTNASLCLTSFEG
ncbi:thiolase-like protein [Kalaharituber pfeilii]|nr:thiolase-like protein [Kalaharituber pfeilii]